MNLGSGGGGALTVGQLTAFLTVDDKQFNQGIDKGQSKFSSFAKGLAGVAAAGVAAAGAAMAGLAVAGLKEFGEFEKGMNEAFTLMPGVTERAMGEMESDVRAFAMEMGTATDEVVPALYSALSAGVPPGNVFDFLEVANKAALGGVTDLETAVDGITSVVNAYGEDVVNAGKASDLMFTAVRLGKTTFDELSASLFQVIPTASALGVNFEDVTAALAELTAQGVPTSVATTQMRQLFVELSKAGGVAADTFEELSGKTFKDFIASGGNTADALDIMRQGAEDAGLGLADMFGSVEAGAAALALAGTDTDGFRESIEEMAGAAGATDAAYEQMDQGITRSLERIGVAWDEVKLVIGEKLAPVLQNLADWVIENMPAIQAKFDELMTKAGEMGTALKEWWTETAKPAWDEFMAALEENRPKVESIMESIGRIFAALGEIVGKETASWSRDTDESTSSIEDSVTDLATALEAFARGVATVTESIAGVWNLLVGGLKGDFGQIQQGLDDLTDGAFTRFGNQVRAVVISVQTWFRNLPGMVLDALGDLGDLLHETGQDLMRGFIGGITSMAAAAARAAMNAVRAAVDGVKGFLGISSPSKLFEQIGRDSMQGLINGEHAMIGDVIREAEAIAAAAAFEVGSSATVGIGAGGLGGINDGPLGGGFGAPNVNVTVNGNLDNVTLPQVKHEIAGAFVQFARG